LVYILHKLSKTNFPIPLTRLGTTQLIGCTESPIKQQSVKNDDEKSAKIELGPIITMRKPDSKKRERPKTCVVGELKIRIWKRDKFYIRES